MPNNNLYGLRQLMDLNVLQGDQAAARVDPELLVSAIRMDIATYNQELNDVLGMFAADTTDYQLAIRTSGSRRNQPLDENGRTIPIKPPVPYTVAFPIIGSGNSHGTNFVTSVQMTVERLASTLEMMRHGDAMWVRDHILAALFANVSYGHIDPEHGDLTILGLANGDATLYTKGGAGTATDTHYLAQADPIGNSNNPYPIISDDLTEHDVNTGDVIALIPTNLKATTMALNEFHPVADPNIRPGSGDAVLTGTTSFRLPRRADIVGYTESKVWIVEWRDLPDSFIIGMTTGGPRPLARRLYPEQELQGFRPQGEREDWPYFEEQWSRFEGYGAKNRVGAVVYRIGDGSYAVPTGYESPMI